MRSRPWTPILVAGGAKLSVTVGASGVSIALPERAPDPVATVVVLDLPGPIRSAGGSSGERRE